MGAQRRRRERGGFCRALADRHNRWGDLGVHDSRRVVRERLRADLGAFKWLTAGGPVRKRGEVKEDRASCCSWGGTATAGLHNHLRLLV